MLEQMTQRLQAQRSFEAAIETLLNDVVALHGAEYGDLQLLAGDDLVIVAQRGLTPAFLPPSGGCTGPTAAPAAARCASAAPSW